MTERHPSLWRNRDYMLLWSGQVVSVLGSSMSGIAFPLLVLSLTDQNYGAAGVIGLLNTVPYLMFSLLAGAMVDRWNRRRVMVLCDAGRAVAFASIPIAILFGWLTLPQVYVVAFVEGCLYVFFNIAEVAALPRVVPKEQLGDATAQNMATFSAAGLVGPGLGGFLYQNIGRAVPFIVDAVSYSMSAISLLFIKTRFQAERAPGERKLVAEIKEGMQWAWNEKLVRLTSFLSGGTNFVASGSFLLVIYQAKAMGADDTAIGVIFTVGAVGGILGAVSGGRIHKVVPMNVIIIASTWVNVICVPLYLLAPNIYVLGIVGALFSFVVPVYSVAVLSYRLALIPDALQGRVNSAVRLVAFGFLPLGSATAGLLLENGGALLTASVFGVVMLGLGLLTLLNPTLRNISVVGIE